MVDEFRQSDLDETTTGTVPEDATDMMEVPGTSDLEGELFTDPGTPFDRLLEARGLSREDSVAVLVDDDEGVREVMSDILMLAFNVKVETASHGKRGLGVLERNLGRTCLVLTDTNMPFMDGPEMLRAANAKGLLDRVPVAIATADAEGNAADITALMKDGIAHTSMRKPFGAPHELVAAINASCLHILNEMEEEARKNPKQSEEAMAGVDVNESNTSERLILT